MKYMIAHVEGKVVEKFAGSVIVDVHGVGYEVQVSLNDFESTQLDSQTKFYTYHHVREQAEDLFGFSSLAAKKLFELLITVQGIGPKAALAILSLGSAEQVRNAVANSDVAYITKASGVGKKSAERVAVDLSDKVGIPTHYVTGVTIQTELNTNDEALDALIALGYSLAEANTALAEVDPTASTQERVKQALKARK
ncbi:MAG: Holliday junction branch migration protein RuvA [Candidatus Saccharimonadales bacterium]